MHRRTYLTKKTKSNLQYLHVDQQLHTQLIERSVIFRVKNMRRTTLVCAD